MSLKLKPIVKNVALRSLLLSAGAFLLLSMAGLSSSSEADEPLFVRSAQQLERLWSGVLGCTHPGGDDTRSTFETTLEGTGAPSVINHDYTECGKRALRSTSSRILVDTIEDAVRSGGVALFDQDFRLDSSIGWTLGENVTGEIDAVVPVPFSLLRSLLGWERVGGGGGGNDEQALFVQPGLVFWPGLEGENRIDGNLGLVYRRHFAPDAVAGGSVFYDYDFERGNRRLGLGADLQSGIVHAGLNYYHPLNDWRAGRTDYEEQALRGGDLRFGLAWSRVRIDASMGVWRFEGEEDTRAKWRSSFGLDAGVRILPGVFLEAGYERHDKDDSLDSRWKTGLAFRFSLPDLDGAPAFRDPSIAPDLFDTVEREKRILYEERLGITRANLTATHATRTEGETTVVTLELSDALDKDVVLHLAVHEASTATLGSDADFSFGYKVYNPGTETAPAGAATDCSASPCEVVIPAGATKVEVSVTIHDDSADNNREQAEYIEMYVHVPERYAGIVRSGSAARIMIRAHGNTIAFASNSASTLDEDGGTAEVTVEIDEPSPVPITLTVTAGGEAVLNTDYTLSTTRLSIPANAGRASLTLTGINDDINEGPKSIILTLAGGLPDGWAFSAEPGPEQHMVTLLDDDLAIGFTASNPTLVGEGDTGTVDLTVAPNRALPAGATVGWSVTVGADDISGSASGSLNFGSDDGRNNPQTIALNVNDDGNAEDAEQVTVTLNATSLPQGWNLGRDTHTFTIEPSDGVVAFTSTDAITADEGDTFDIGITSTVDGPSGGYPLAISFSPSASSDITFPATVTLPAGSKSQSFSIRIQEDGAGEEAETFTMSLGSGGSAGDWTVSGTRTVTINPNEIVVGFASSTATAREGGAKVDTLLSITPPPTADSKVPFTLGGDGATAANYTFALTNASGQGSAGFANNQFDYRANETGVNIGVLAMEDNDNIVDETLVITIDESRLPPGWRVGDHGVLTVTLADNDIPTIGFAADILTEVTEGALPSVGQTPTSIAQIRIDSSRTLPRDVDINVAITGDAEHPGIGGQADYVLETGRNPPTAYANGVVTLRSGETKGLLVLSAQRDDDGDAAETVTFTLSGTLPPGWRFGDTEHTITIIDAESIPSIGFAERSSMVEEPAGSGTATHTIPLPITRSLPRDFTLDVILDRASTANADGTAGVVDFVETRTIDLKRGDSGMASLDITINGDDESEVDETIIVTLDYMNQSRPEDWRYGNRRRHTITILANDNTITFSEPSSGSIAEEEGTGIITATINQPIPEEETATVTITPGGDAVKDTDYELSVSGGELNGNTWTLPTQVGTATLTVTAKDTPDTKSDRTLTLGFAGETLPDGWSVTDVSRSITIDNDDVPKKKIGFAAASKTITVSEDVGTTALMLQLSNDDGTPYTGNTVILNMQASVAKNDDFQIDFDDENEGIWFPSGHVTIFDEKTYEGGLIPLTITVDDDEEDEGAETFTIALVARSIGFPTESWEVDEDNDSFTLNINDNDAVSSSQKSTFQFAESFGSINPTIASEGDTVELTVTSSGAADTDVPVAWEVTSGASEADDPDSGIVTIPNGGDSATFAVTITDDDDTDPPESVTVTLSDDADGSDTWTPDDRTIHTINVATSDNVVSLGSPSSGEISEGGQASNVSVNIAGTMLSDSADVRIDFSGTASDGDFTVTAASPASFAAGTRGGILAIPANRAETRLSVTATGDDDAEIGETLILTLNGTHADTTLPEGGWKVASGSGASREITIEANDNEILSLVPDDTRISETGGTSNISIIINEPLPEGEEAVLTVTPREESGDAIRGTDYRLLAGGTPLTGNRWTLPTGVRLAILTIEALHDTEHEGAGEDVVLTIATDTLPQGWSAGTGTHTVTIADDDDLLSVMFTDSNSVLSEVEGTVDAGITLSKAAPSDGLDVTASVTSGSEYIVLAADTIAVAGGETTGNFTVNILPGVANIPFGATAELTLTAPGGWILGTQSTHTVNITPAVRVAFAGGIDEYTVLEGESVDVNFTAGSARLAAFDIDASIPDDDRPFVSVDSARANTFEAGSSRGRITFNATDNSGADGDRTVTVTLTKGANFPDGWLLLPESVTLAITDDDDDVVRSIGFAHATSSAFEGGEHDIEFAVSGYTVPGEGFPLNNLGVSGALADVLYEGFALESSSSVTILPGANAGDNPRFSVRINSSDGPEDAETVTFTLPDPLGGGFTPGTNSTHTLTIEPSGNSAFFNAGTTPPQNLATVGEGDGTAILTVSLHPFGAPKGGLPLKLKATSGNDANLVTFDENGGEDGEHSFEIPEGEKSHEVTVRINDNTDYVEAGGQNVIFTLTAGDNFPSGWGGVNGQFDEFTLTVTDDDNAPGKRRVGFAQTRMEVTEVDSDTSVAYHGKLVDAAGRPASVPADMSFAVELALKSAGTSDVSYSGKTHTINSGTALDAQGVTTDPLDTFIVRRDDDAELEEVVTIIMRPGTDFPSDSWQITPNELEVVIAPNDNKVKFASPDATVAEDAGRHDVTVGIGMPYSAGSITFNIETSGDATIGEDYNVGTSVTIDAGSGTANIPVDVIDDSTFGENDETVVLTIKAAGELPTGWGIDGDNDEFSLTITDNDEPPSGMIGFASSNPVAATEGGSVPLTITSTGAPFEELVFNWQVTDSDGESDVDVSPDNGTVTISANQTSGRFGIAVAQDQNAEAAEQITVTLTDPNIGDLFTLDEAARTHTLIIAAEDNTIAFDPASDSIILEEGATSAIVTLNIDAPIPSSHTGDVTVDIGRAGNADEGGDYAIEGTGYSEGVLTLPKGQAAATLTVEAVDDGDHDPDENIMLSISNLTGAPDGWALGSQTTHAIDITDNNVTGTFGFPEEGNVEEVVEGTPVTLTVKASQVVDTIVPVGWRFWPSNEILPPTGGRIEIADGADTATLTFTLADDDIAEGTEEAYVELFDMDTSDGWMLGTETTEESVHTLIVAANQNTVGFADGMPVSVAEPEIISSVNIKIVSDNNVPDGGLEFTLQISGANQGEASFSPDPNTPQTGHTFSIEEGKAESADIPLYFHADVDTVSETIILTLTAANPSTFPTAWGTAPDLAHEIEINEPAVVGGTIGFAASGSDIDEPLEGSTAEHTVNINAVGTIPDSAFHITVNAAGSAEDPADYIVSTPLNADIRVARNSVSNGVLPLIFTINGDDIPEYTETIELSLPEEQPRMAEQWTLGNKKTHTIRINANDNTIGFAPLDYYRIEEGESIDVIVAINAPPPFDGSFGISIEGDDSIDVVPLEGSTYDEGILGFSAGADSAGIRITAKNDSRAEAGGERVAFTILEDPAAPLPDGWEFSRHHTLFLTIEPSDNIIGLAALAGGDDRIEEGESADIIVEVDQPLPVERSVLLDIDGDSEIDVEALEGSNYNNGILQIEAGAESVGIRATAKRDSDAEIAEEVTFTLSERGTVPLPTGWEIGTGTQTVTIEPNGNTVSFAAPSLSTITEEEGGANKTTVTATIDKPIPAGLSATIAVTLTLADGSTAQSGDYTLSVANAGHGSVSGNIWTLPTGAGSATLTVTAVDNSVDAPDKTLTLGFTVDSLPSGWAAPADTSYDITIVDDDLSGTFQFAESQDTSAEEGDTVRLAIMANKVTEADVPVTWTVTSGSEDVTDPDTGTVTIPSGEDSATFDIEITDEDVAEYAKTVTITLSDAADRSDLWTPHGATEHTITIPANDNTIRIEAPSPSAIDEDGGIATITAIIDKPILADAPADTAVVITPSSDRGRTDIRHFNGRFYSPDYSFSVAPGNGSLGTGRQIDRWILPKETGRATLTITANDNAYTVSSEDTFADMPDKEITLGFHGISLPAGWSVPADTSHDITIIDDVLPDAERNTIGIMTNTANNTVTLREGGMASFMLKISNADGTPYANNLPGSFVWQYTPTGADNSRGQDFNIVFDVASAYWFEPIRKDARATFGIENGASFSDGLVPLTITVEDDAVTEGMETFHYRIHGLRSSAYEDWRVDTNADTLTVVILASDNNVEFAQASSEDVPEDGGSALITLNIADPIEQGETITVDLGITGAVEGTDFAIDDGTATYDGGTLTLPTGAEEATFTLRAVDNPADDEDRTLALTLSNITSALGDWGGLGEQTTHDVRITSNAKNTIGFTSDSITVAEDVGSVTSVMLQLATPQGTPYAGIVPANLSPAYSSTGTNDNDFSIVVNSTQTGTSLGAAGSLEIPQGQSFADGQIPITITITDDEVEEGVEEFVYTLANPSSPSRFPHGTWTVAHFADRLTLTILASDSSVEFAQDSSRDISENGGRARITLNLGNPIPDGETVTVDLGITGATGGTDFTVIDGTAAYSGGKLTLPTNATEADFILEAQNNNTSALDKILTLTLSNLSGEPDDWGGLGGRTSHSVTIVDDDKNTIGFAPRRIAVDEDDGTASAMLQLSNADGTPYAGAVPENLSLAYVSTGTNDNDFSIVVNNTQTGTTLGTQGTVSIPPGESPANGQIPITITINEDDVPENVEEFVYTVEASPSPFPAETWQVAPDAGRFTLVITDNDNTVSFVTSQVLEESTGNLSIPVMLSSYAAQNLTFNVNMVARDERTGRRFPVEGDISSYARTITFSANGADRDNSAPGHQQAAVIGVEPVRGDGPENKELFWIELTPASPLPPGFVIPRYSAATSVSRTIAYDTPTFVIPAHDNTINFAADQPAAVAEGESITLELVFDSPVPTHMRIDLVSDADDASDITITPALLVIDGALVGRNNILDATFSVTANHDGDALNETITITPVFDTGPVVPPEGWEIPETTKHTFTIEDDESATVLFDPDNRTSLLEAEGEVSLRVNFENGNVPAGGVGLSLASSDPARVRIPDEFSSFTVGEGQDSFAFIVDVLADDNAAADTVTLTLRKGTDGNGAGFPSEWDLKDDAGELTLELNIEDRGKIGFARSSDTVAEPDSTVVEHTVPLAFSSAPEQDLILAFDVTSDGAVGSRNTGDFFVDTLYTVAVEEISDGMADYPILILPDDEYEQDEGFTITLASSQPDLPGNWYIDPDNAGYTVTIPINDLPSRNTLGFTAPSMTVKEQTGNVEIEITSSAPAPDEGLPLKVTLAKASGSRTVFTDDASAATRNLMIKPSESSTNFSVSIFDDANESADEDVTFTLSFGENFPHEWGTGWAPSTITVSTLVLTIDDRDNGVIGFVDPLPEFYEPYPGETTYKSGYDDAVDRYFEMSISDVPRQAFDLRLESGDSHLKPAATIWEVVIPDENRVTPEDAADGRLSIRFPIETGHDNDAPKEYGRLVIDSDSLPAGWSVGQHPQMDYAIIDSFTGGQIGFAPNDTRVNNSTYNRSTFKEGQSGSIALTGDSYGEDSPIWVRIEGGTGRNLDSDLNFEDFMVVFPSNETFHISDSISTGRDDRREEDKSYTLVLEEADGFPGERGRRIDPARGRYTFTVLASGGFISFSSDNNTALTEGDGSRQLFLALEGGEPPGGGIGMTLTSSNPAIIDIPAEYRNFTIPAGYSSANYPISIEVKNDDNDISDAVTLTLGKDGDENRGRFPNDWGFTNDAEELTLDLWVVDKSSVTPSGTIQFLSAGRTAFEPKFNPVALRDNRSTQSIYLQVTAPPLDAFDLPIEVSGSASFGIADGTCGQDCLDGTYDVTRHHRSTSNPVLPLESPDDDTVFARIQPSVSRGVNLEFWVNDDTEFEEEETFVLTIPEDAPLPAGFTLGERRRFVLTIPANDNTVEFASGESNITEGGAHATVTISINRPFQPETSGNVLMGIEHGEGVSDNDYIISGVTGGSFDAESSTFTIPAGVDSVTFNVTASDDTVAEPDESITFTLDANGSSFPENWGGIGSQALHTVTIRDDETTGIGFVGAVVEPSGENATVSLRVNISSDIGRDLAQFAWTVSPTEDVENPTGTATISDKDYSLDIKIKDDDLAELAEEVTVTLIDSDTSDIWSIDGKNATRTFTIPASDNAVTFAAPSPATISEDGGIANITAFIRRPAPSGEAPVVAITPGGDAGGGDYNFSVAAGNGSLSEDNTTWTLPTEADSATLTVTAVNNDDDDDGNKTLTLGFADAATMPAGWSVSGTLSHAIAIADDDDVASTGTVQFAHASSSAIEGTEDTILHVPVLVTGTPANAFNLKVNVVSGEDEDNAATQGGEGVEGGDFTVPATLNISGSGSTNLEVTILADTVAELAETFVLEIPSEDSGLPEDGLFTLDETIRHTVTIDINDNTVGFAAAESLVLENIGIAEVPVGINQPAPYPITFNVSTTAVTAIEEEDYSLLTSLLTIDAGEQTGLIEVSIINDNYLEGDEDVVLTVSTSDALPYGWSLGTARHTLTIESEDHIVSFTETFSHSVTENGDSVEATIQITPPLRRDINVPLRVNIEGKPTYDYDVIHPESASVTGNWLRFVQSEDPEFIRLRFHAIDDRDGVSGSVAISFNESRLPAGFVLGEHTTWTINVTDNDTRAVSLRDTFTQLNEGTRGIFKIQISPPLAPGQNPVIALRVHGELSYPHLTRSSHRYFPTSGQTDSYAIGDIRPTSARYEGRHLIDYGAAPCTTCPFAYQNKPQLMQEGFSAIHRSTVTFSQAGDDEFVALSLRALQDSDNTDDRLTISLKEDEIPDGYYIPDDAIRTFTVNFIDNRKPSAYVYTRRAPDDFKWIGPEDINAQGLTVVHRCEGETVRISATTRPPRDINIGQKATWSWDYRKPPPIYGEDGIGEEILLVPDGSLKRWGTVRVNNHTYDVDLLPNGTGRFIVGMSKWPDGMERGDPWGVWIQVRKC